MHIAWTSAAKSAKKRKRLAKGGDAVLRAFGDPEDVAAEPTIDDVAVAEEARGEDATCTLDETEPRRKTRVEETTELQQRGNALAQAGEFSAALSTWDAAIGLSAVPRQRAVLFEQKAQVLMEMGRLWEAVRAGTCATEIAPDWHDAWVTLARAQLNLGEPHLAQASFSRALVLQPGSTETQQELGEASRLAVRQRQLAAAADGGDEMLTRGEERLVREGPEGGGQQQQEQQQEEQQQQGEKQQQQGEKQQQQGEKQQQQGEKQQQQGEKQQQQGEKQQQQGEKQQQQGLKQQEQEHQQGRRRERGHGVSDESNGLTEAASASTPDGGAAAAVGAGGATGDAATSLCADVDSATYR